ncbi:MAG: SIMPL domain-containing protein [Gammaproteobacteria bacterium]|nr:SIMPL domain-containing protein [Gammaproteobacteria bacterium]
MRITRYCFMLPLLLTGLFDFASAQADIDPVFDQVHLTVSAQEEVENNTLVALLSVFAENKEAKAAASTVNEKTAWALAEAAKVKPVKTQTLNYRTSPIYKKQKVTGWRVQQSIRLESEDTAMLSELIGTLQESLALQSINYQISHAAHQKAEELLTQKALATFQARAKIVAEALGAKQFKLLQINIHHAAAPPVYPSRMRAVETFADKAAAAPSFQKGVQTVSLSVSGSIQLER